MAKYSIYEWMVTDLKISGNELIIFSIINSFCIEHKTEFNCSISYLTQKSGVTKPTVIKLLTSLTQKGILTKKEIHINNVKLCSYSLSQNTTNLRNKYGVEKRS